jgi:hypothetical protein
MNLIGQLVSLALIASVFSSAAIAQDDANEQTLITNGRIFDGVNDGLTAGNVLVEGNLIKQPLLKRSMHPVARNSQLKPPYSVNIPRRSCDLCISPV